MKISNLFALGALLLGIQWAGAQGTDFTYQGRLLVNGSPASGSNDFQFRIYTDPSVGGVVGPVLTKTNVLVTDGLVNLELDFGAGVFTGGERWLQISYRSTPPSILPSPVPPPYTNMLPRVHVTPTPYAILAASAAAVASNGVTTLSLQDSSVTAGKIASGNVVKWLNGVTDYVNLVPGSNVTVTTTATNIVISATGGGGNTSNAWLLAGNTGTTPGVNFLGTTDNQPLELKAGGQRALRLEPNGANNAPNLVGGSSANAVDSGAVGATIGGGGAVSYVGQAYSNRVSAAFGVIGGGGRNTIQPNASSSTIAGGLINTIQSSATSGSIGGGYANTLQTNAVYATIAGGISNTVQTGSRSAAVGGGESNTVAGVYNTIAGGRLNSALGTGNTVSGGSNNVANGSYTTISGGEHNTVSGDYGTVVGGVGNIAGYSGTVVGGRLNTAMGNSAVAMGNLAAANHTGSFVYSDNIGTPFASTAVNQFSIRAGGGVRLDDNTSMSFGATTRQMLNLYHTDFGVGVQDYTFYLRTGPGDGFAWYAGGVHSTYQNDPGAGGSTLMTLDPASNLRIYGTLTVDANSDGDGSVGTGIRFGEGSGETIVSRRTSGTNQYGLDFFANNLPRLSIQNGGNVGIGTQSPGAKLDVAGTVRATAFVGDGSGLVNLPGSIFSPSGTPQVGAVVTASDVAGHARWSPELKALSADRYAGVFPNRSWFGSANLIAGSSYNAVNNGVIGATVLGGGSAAGNPDLAFGPLTIRSNYAGADFATVLGGQANAATGYSASAIGGRSNVAAGQYSMAVGQRAKALHDGSFVWADSQSADYASTAYDQFSIRAAGGIRFDGDLWMQDHDIFLRGNGDQNHSLTYRGTVAGMHVDGPYLQGYDGGALGGSSPETVSLLWDWQGNVWVSNNLSTATLNVRGSIMSVKGAGNEQAYLGGDGVGNDVQIGSENSSVTAVTLWNRGYGGRMSLEVSSITIAGGADLAEPFQMSAADIPKGALVVIDEDHPGQLKLAEEPYDRRVAGIISGANDIKPGITLHQEGKLEGGQNVALTGRVYALADTSNGPIKPGDLLTSSGTPGHVMKVTDHAKAQGAIVGKAMGALPQGKGLVLVLVSLQ